jgi:hypothetical protein
MLHLLLFCVIFVSISEWILQALWAKFYFRHGCFLHVKIANFRPVLPDEMNVEQNKLLQNFEIKRMSNTLFAIRQGKFWISRNIFFHGCAMIDAQNRQIKVSIFLNLNCILFFMWLGLQISGHQWWGAICMVVLAWAMARYYVDDVLMKSIAARAQIELEGCEIFSIESVRQS